MEREEYLKPEITSDTIEIGVYGLYIENEDPVSRNNGNRNRNRNRGKH